MSAATITWTNYRISSGDLSPRPYLSGLRLHLTASLPHPPPPPPIPMARLLAQTLTLSRPAPSASLRGLATKVEVIEIDLSSDADADADAGSSPASSHSVEVVGIRRLEEAIHGVMVRRATPDWLPFVPGGSFWVPPLRRPQGVAELVGRIAAAGGAEGPFGAGGGGAVEVVEIDAPMTEEEALSFSTARGWPSASYFVEVVNLRIQRGGQGKLQLKLMTKKADWLVLHCPGITCLLTLILNMREKEVLQKNGSAELNDFAMTDVHMDGKDPIDDGLATAMTNYIASSLLEDKPLQSARATSRLQCCKFHSKL
ncbi:hypothetical protein ACP70R_003140 [Stipagrostis hirtigluma subsp. patula]